MKTKYFKTGANYFKFINKHKNLIDIKSVSFTKNMIKLQFTNI